jgi:hypothetical protein
MQKESVWGVMINKGLFELTIAEDEIGIRDFIYIISLHNLYIPNGSFEQWIKYPHLLRLIVLSHYEGKPVGCAILLKQGDINGYTYGVYVDPEYRRYHLGYDMTSLMRKSYDGPLYVYRSCKNLSFWDSLGEKISLLDRPNLCVIMGETFEA